MYKLLVMLFIIITPAAVHAADVLKIGDTQSITIDVTEGWQLNPMMSPPGIPVKTIHLVKNGTKIMLTLFGSKDGSLISKNEEELSALTLQSSQQYVPSSVEGKISLKNISGKNIKGFYASFTDKQWAGKEIPNGEYACVTSGTFLSNGIVISATFLSRGLSSKTYQEGIAIIQSLGIKS